MALHPSNLPRVSLDHLEDSIRSRWDLAQKVKEIEGEMKNLSEIIMAGLSAQGMTAYETEDLVASIVTSTRSTLSERRLLERGVPMNVIEDSKTKSTSSYVKVAKRDEPHVVGTEAPTKENDPIGRFRVKREAEGD